MATFVRAAAAVVSDRRPRLEDVVAAVIDGRVTRLSLRPEQKHALRGRDRQIALHGLRHALAARASLEAPAAFPYTAELV